MKRMLLVVAFIGGSAIAQEQPPPEISALFQAVDEPPPHTIVAPAASSITVSPVTVGDLLKVLGSTHIDPVKLTALVNAASVDTILSVVRSVANSQEKLNTLIGSINSPDLLFKVASALAASAPDQTVFANIVKTNPRFEVTVLVLDLPRWFEVRELSEEISTYGGNWLGAAINHLRQRIAREGYSDGVMAEFQQLKERLAQPVQKTSSGTDSTSYK